MKLVQLSLLSLLLFRVVYANDLKVISVNEPPANFINQSGMPDGYVVDIVKAIQKTVGNKTKIEFLPEGRALSVTENRADTVLFSLSKTDHRKNKYLWLAQVMSKKWLVYSLKTSNEIITNVSQLKKLSQIGVVRGDVREEWLITNNFTNLYPVTNHEQNVRRLLMGRVSAIVYEEQGLSYICQELGIDISLFQAHQPLNISPVFIVMSKDTMPAVFAVWQAAFDKLLANGEIESISKYWQSKLKQEFAIESKINGGILHF